MAVCGPWDCQQCYRVSSSHSVCLIPEEMLLVSPPELQKPGQRKVSLGLPTEGVQGPGRPDSGASNV